MRRLYWVYIVGNVSGRSSTLYTGMTNDLQRRILEHRRLAGSEFTRDHKLTRLLHFEEYDYALDAITREKQIKGWTRARKIALIEAENPTWNDLAADWGW